MESVCYPDCLNKKWIKKLPVKWRHLKCTVENWSDIVKHFLYFFSFLIVMLKKMHCSIKLLSSVTDYSLGPMYPIFCHLNNKTSVCKLKMSCITICTLRRCCQMSNSRLFVASVVNLLPVRQMKQAEPIWAFASFFKTCEIYCFGNLPSQTGHRITRDFCGKYQKYGRCGNKYNIQEWHIQITPQGA